MIGRAFILAASLLLAAPPVAQAADEAVATLQGQAIALMRHGGAVLAAPGQAPPVPGCDPRAVLTEVGREEMRRFGRRLREAGLAEAQLLVSRQCSAWETAVLLGLGPIAHEPALEPMLDALPPAEREARRQQLAQLVVSVGARRDAGAAPVILITHRANIASLTGIEVVQGEALLLQPTQGAIALVGRLQAD